MAKKFGTFQGVFVPSTEAILGTVLFLLLPLLTADVGLVPILFVIILAHSVTISTAFSLSDCATNLNKISGGGMYALSKRSLGKAFGGSIGLQLFIAQAASIGFYSIGFVEPLQPIVSPLLTQFPFFNDVSPQGLLLQKQILASIVFIVFFIIVMVGADFTTKIQTLILFILAGSIVVIFFSPFTKIHYADTAVFSSFSQINLFGNRPLTIALFFFVFTQFFPAVTGIDAGVGMSGDLKNPRKSLVKGTFTAILLTFAIYLGAAVIFSLINKDVLITGYNNESPAGILLTRLLGFGKAFPANIFGFIILLGILFATSSSALSCFMTAPRTAQSLSKDNVLPGFLRFLQYDFSKKGTEPRFATLVTFIIGMCVIWIGSINLAAMIVGICYLVVYGWINCAAFLERISGNPTFRPTSRGNWVISLYGFLSSMIAIILFNWIIGIIIIVTQLIIFKLILTYKSQKKLEGVWWGVVFSFVTKALKSLKKIVQGSKNWRPVLTAIAFDGKNNCPREIGFLADAIASFKGLVSLNIISSDEEKAEKFEENQFSVPLGFIIDTDPTSAVLNIIQIAHPGGIVPNTYLIEFEKKLNSIKIIKTMLNLEKNILILKNGRKLKKYSHIDIWWRNEENGNLMLFLAYIIYNSAINTNKEDVVIRIIRILTIDEEEKKVQHQLSTLLEKSRLSGTIIILPYTEDNIHKTVRETSQSSDLIMIGMPGKYSSSGKLTLFNFDEFFFDREIEKYDDFPPVLFVKSAKSVNLIED